MNATGKLFTTISEGQVIGEYTLTGIKPTHLVLTAPGGQQQLNFNKKTDRPVGGSPVAPALAGANDVDATGGGSQQQPTSTVDASGKLPPTAAPTSVASTPAVSSDSALKNPAPGSLAAAIVAAQAAAQNPAPQAQNAPPPANFNPFLQLLPKQ